MEQAPKILLGSGSPRRKELLKAMGLEFRVIRLDVDERFPADLPPAEAVMYLAEKKAAAYTADDHDLLITADTLVYLDGEFLGKPDDEQQAVELLERLSGREHEVYTGVCLSLQGERQCFYAKTKVRFRVLTSREIRYYVRNDQPLDKAGAYGIQEWIGWIGVSGIDGSYSNVMGLPTALLHEKLETILGKNRIFVRDTPDQNGVNPNG